MICSNAWKLRIFLIYSVVAGFIWAVPAFPQVAHSSYDPNGIAIPYQRVRLVHSQDIKLKGATGNLRAFDPFLFYQLGRDLLTRQFSLKEGLYGRSGEQSVPLYIRTKVDSHNQGTDARFSRDDTASCASCHSMPPREPGGGQTISSTGGAGRNTPHFYGAGMIEMIGEQTRARILNLYDTNRNGLIDRAEVASSCPVKIAPVAGGGVIDYGDLAPGQDGTPQLNSAFLVWYLDGKGNVIEGAKGMNDPRVVAFDFSMQPFGWGRGHRNFFAGHAVSEGGEASTIREFFTVASDVHLGLQAYDPSQQRRTFKGDDSSSGEGGVAGVSLNGALQFDFGGSTDKGTTRTETGVSLDDPDKDGQINELTEGDVDAAEFYMLHSPAPAVRATRRSELGRTILKSVGCTRCHVENWKIEAKDKVKGFTGDRRLFDLVTRSLVDKDGVPQIVGSLVPLYDRLPGGEYRPKYGALIVRRIYSDFKQWDIGSEFHERRFDGSLQREHRTTPLWGAGSTAPYGHSGQYLTLDDVIRAHAGAATRERSAYLALSLKARNSLIEYLESLALYSTDEIAADINGDNAISDHFKVAGQEVGYERFDARFLFANPPRYKHLYDVKSANGRAVPLMLIENVDEAYGFSLQYRRDADGDGFPDILGLPPSNRVGKKE